MKKLLLVGLVAFTMSCSNENSKSEYHSAPVAVAFFKGTLDGQAVDFRQDGSLTPAYFFNFAHSFDQLYVIDYGCYLYPSQSQTGHPELGMYFDNMYNNPETTNEPSVFYTTFGNPLPTNFLTSVQEDAHVKGIEVTYTDENGKSYSSLYGSQTGSTMTVTSSVSGIEKGTSHKIQTIIGAVNCKVYNDQDPTDFKTITNGEYKLVYRQYVD